MRQGVCKVYIYIERENHDVQNVYILSCYDF